MGDGNACCARRASGRHLLVVLDLGVVLPELHRSDDPPLGRGRRLPVRRQEPLDRRLVPRPLVGHERTS